MNYPDTKTALDAETLRRSYIYDSQTGHFFFRSVHGHQNGGRAGTREIHGYRSIAISGRKYKEHRLAWLYVYGVWPIGQLDHANRVRDDNRIANLREANQSLNNANSKRKLADCGCKGVTVTKRRSKPYMARITVMGKTHYLGRYHTAAEAGVAYAKAFNKYFGDFVTEKAA